MNEERNGEGLTQRTILEWMSWTDPLAVGIDDFSFAPGSLTVKAGTTVTLTNRGDIAHTVTSTTRLFKSKPLDADNNKLSFTFATPGSYEYFCSLHPRMTGKIMVEAMTGSSRDP